MNLLLVGLAIFAVGWFIVQDVRDRKKQNQKAKQIAADAACTAARVYTHLLQLGYQPFYQAADVFDETVEYLYAANTHLLTIAKWLLERHLTLSTDQVAYLQQKRSISAATILQNAVARNDINSFRVALSVQMENETQDRLSRPQQ